MVDIDIALLRRLLSAVRDNQNITLWPDLAVASISALPRFLDYYDSKRRLIFEQIDAERMRQHSGGDDARPRAAWASMLGGHVSTATRAGNAGNDDEWRHRMIVIASLCVAAVEAHDRRASQPIEPLEDPRCGSQGVDAEGRCTRCGLAPFEDGDVVYCPPGFLRADGPR